MKRVQLRYEDMPTIEGEEYLIRARVVSNDENRKSHWVYFKVPNYKESAPPFNAASGGIETTDLNYRNSGEAWKIHKYETGTEKVFTPTSFERPFLVLIAAGGNGANYYVGETNPGGEVIEQEFTINGGLTSADIVVGSGGAGGQNNKQPGQPSTFLGVTASPGGTPGAPVASSITGSEVLYGGISNGAGTYGRGGNGAANSGQGGQPGVIIIAYKIADAE